MGGERRETGHLVTHMGLLEACVLWVCHDTLTVPPCASWQCPKTEFGKGPFQEERQLWKVSYRLPILASRLLVADHSLSGCLAEKQAQGGLCTVCLSAQTFWLGAGKPVVQSGVGNKQ